MLWGSVALAALTAACVTPKTGAPTGMIAAEGDVSGTWEGAFERDVPNGAAASSADHEVERHTWRLQQVGQRVRGVLFVELTLTSKDGRAFVCSGRTQLTAWLTSEVTGHRQGNLMAIAEQRPPRAEGQCQPPPREASQYAARLSGDTLLIGVGREQQRLVRRRNATPRSSPTTAELAIGGHGQTLAMIAPRTGVAFQGLASARLQGHWVWDQQAQLPNGDNKREREEWHLVQEGSEVVGFYERTVEQRSTDGRLYRCNGLLDFRTVTRYEVRGTVFGPRFTFNEQAFEVIEGGACDDGKRQLDSYQGEVRDAELVLTFGVGQQILRRARPNVPTQSF